MPQTDPKRLIGQLEDKTYSGYFDLAASTLDPPASEHSTPPVPANTAIVAHLPKKFRKTDFVAVWAKRFGSLSRIVLDIKSGKCLVEWSSSSPVAAAMSSLRMRGDGKEHIRVYRYRGVRSRAAQHAPVVEREVEEGEIEEGEVVEPSMVKSKKKKSKAKKRLEQRLTEPDPVPVSSLAPAQPFVASVAGISSVALPPATAVQPASPISPPLTSHSRARASSLRSNTAVVNTVLATPSITRPSLIERFLDPPTSGEEWEAEMMLDSDDEDNAILLTATTYGTAYDHIGGDTAMSLGDLDPDEEEDMDVERSSPIANPPSLPSKLSVTSSVVPVTFSSTPSSESGDAVASSLLPLDESTIDLEGERRRKLEETITRVETQRTLRTIATNSRTSLTSSGGTSESPEPLTPEDAIFLGAMRVVESSDASTDIDTDEEREERPARTPVSPTLDELAVSFITESIQTATAALGSSSASIAPPTAPTPSTIPVVAPIPTTAPIRPLIPLPPKPQPYVPVPTPLTEEQRTVRQKRWLELVGASKSLITRIASTRVREEKDLLMRLLRAKTK